MSERDKFEKWRDESPNQRYGTAIWEAWQAAIAASIREDELRRGGDGRCNEAAHIRQEQWENLTTRKKTAESAE